MKLFYRTFGEGYPMVILHGLFGSSDNWNTLAKAFATHFRVLTVDQRNHGRSPHRDEHNYRLLVEDLSAFIAEHRLQKPILLGHSMGGKTVMNAAVKHPEKVGPIVVADIAPKAYSLHHDLILKGLQSIQLTKITSRAEADRRLSRYIKEAPVRQFLLKNLSRRQDNTFTWKINLPTLVSSVDEVQAGMQYPGTFNGPALFLYGSRSNYVDAEDKPSILSLFPHAHFTVLPTGHWIHAEQPQSFFRAVMEFLHPPSGSYVNR